MLVAMRNWMGDMKMTFESHLHFTHSVPDAWMSSTSTLTFLTFFLLIPLSSLTMSEGIELRPVGSSTPKPPPRRPDTDGAPGSLSSAYRRAEEKAKAVVHLQEGQLDSISIWGLVSTAWYVQKSPYTEMVVFIANPSTPQLKSC